MYNITINFNEVDIFIGCVYFDVCTYIIRAANVSNLNAKSIILTVCVDNPIYLAQVGVGNGQYIIGPIQWNERLVNTDTYTGWTAEQFATLFRQRYDNSSPAYQTAAFFASALALTHALEKSLSLQSADVSFALSRLDLDTFYGLLQFDSNGQITLDFSYIQFDSNTNLKVVIPDSSATGSLIYPMPSFPYRRCMLSNGINSCKCSASGCSKCSLSSFSYNISACLPKNNFRDVIFSQNQECELSLAFVPPANTTVGCGFLPYTSNPGIFVLGMACLSAVTGFLFLVWIIWHRKHPLIGRS